MEDLYNIYNQQINIGKLYIYTNPMDARVRIMNIVPKYYFGIQLKPGKYQIRVDKEGYEAVDRWVNVSSGENHFRIELTQKTQMGRLYVHPRPEDARVRIMNIVPPYENGMELDPGEYHIRVDKQGYETVDQWVDLEAGEKMDVAVELSKKGLSTVVSSSSSSSSDVRTPRPGETWTEPVTGMEFVWVPGVCYEMGSNHGGSDEKPVNEVCVDGFWMGKYEVTNRQYKLFDSSHSSESYESHTLDNGDQPVVYVSWEEAQKFIKWLNRRNSGSSRFCLPIEAEWEYAARSGGKHEKYAGGGIVDRVAWYRVNNGGRPHPVGAKSPNGLGLFDMSGNVFEWCQDWYASDAYIWHFTFNPVITSGGSRRVSRGGSWNSWPIAVRCVNRYSVPPRLSADFLGFRLLRTFDHP